MVKLTATSIRTFLIAGLLIFCPISGFSLKYGLNCGAPIDAQTGTISPTTNGALLADTGARWIRVNFILGPWDSPTDPTLRGSQNLSWFATYDRIINDMRDHGLLIYGLIGHESVKGHGRATLNTESFVQDYTANFVAIVDHFKDRVQIFESFNEPNDWAGGTSSQVEPRWFARYLESIYRAIKIDNNRLNDPVWQNITLVSGPLFTHFHDTGANYFTQTWQAGKNQLEWDTIRSITGSYPFDGVGIHIYVAEGNEPDNELTSLTKRNLDAMYNSLVSLEGAGTQKKFYNSEFGWTTDYVSEAVQAHKLNVAYDYYESDARIAHAYWFTFMDFPGGAYGLYRYNNLTPSGRKPSYEVYRTRALAGREEDDAQLGALSIPVWFEPGVGYGVTASFLNTGTAVWQADGNWRLGAGSTATGNLINNESLWSGFSHGGYSNSPLDQRIFLGSENVPPGSQATFSFQAHFPDETPPGPGNFAARMVQEGEDWFGDLAEYRPLVAMRSDNLLTNGSFETGNLQGWTLASGAVDGVQQGAWLAGIQSLHGDHFLGAAANWGQKSGILYQTIPVVPGEEYGVVAGIQTHRVGGNEGDVASRLGLDPAGGQNPAAAGVLWTAWSWSPGQWKRIGLNATAQADRMTLFLEHRHQAPEWNINAYDDILLAGPPVSPDSVGWMLH